MKKQHSKKKAEERLILRDIIAISLFDSINKGADERVKTILAAAREIDIEPEKWTPHIHWPILVARRCYAQADAFLAARKTKPA